MDIARKVVIRKLHSAAKASDGKCPTVHFENREEFLTPKELLLTCKSCPVSDECLSIQGDTTEETDRVRVGIKTKGLNSFSEEELLEALL